MANAGRGPSWLGIGAQRSGTTWFSGLLTQHPAVAVPHSARLKDAVVMSGYSVGTLTDGLHHPDLGTLVSSYRAEFPASPGQRLGEFSPAYLRCLWVPPLAKEACRDDVVIVALLRDPVERFFSAMRLAARVNRERRSRGQPPHGPAFAREQAAAAQWTGCYASQLEAWAGCFPDRNICVFQYEQVRRYPAAAAAEVWARLGLDPVPLGDVTRPSGTATDPDGAAAEVPGLRRQLVDVYRPQVDALVRRWGVDPALWPNYAA